MISKISRAIDRCIYFFMIIVGILFSVNGDKATGAILIIGSMIGSSLADIADALEKGSV